MAKLRKKRGAVNEPPRKANLRKLHPAGHYPGVEDRAALELAIAIHEAESDDVAVSWSAQERAMEFFNKYGLAETLDEILRLKRLAR